jgi:hypothetical protein
MRSHRWFASAVLGLGLFNWVLCAAADAAGSKTVDAHIPIGGTTVQYSATTTIFTGSGNTKGIDLRTIVTTCTGESNLLAISPSNENVLILQCIPSNFGATGASQAYGLYLPAGWGLQWQLESSGGDIEMTYDQK